MSRSNLFHIIVLATLLVSACSSVGNYPTDFFYDDVQLEQLRIEKIRKYTQVLKTQNDSLFEYEMDSVERSNNQITGLFTINRIYKGEGLYVITLSSSDSCRYELYSIEIPQTPDYETISEGMSCVLTLVPCYSTDTNHLPRVKEISRPFHVDNYLVVPAPIYYGQIYYTRDLLGLQYHCPTHYLEYRIE